MSRDLLGSWATGLNDDELAAALAAIGVAAAADAGRLGGPEDELGAWWGGLVGALDSAAPVPWLFPTGIDGWDDVDAAVWAGFWNAQSPRGWARFAVAGLPELSQASWLVGLFGAGPVFAESVFVVVPAPDAVPAAWRFPIRLGVLPDEAGSALAAGLASAAASTGWIGTLLTPVRLGVEAVTCDILAVVGGDAGSIDRLREARATAVIAIGAQADLESAALAATKVGASVVGAVGHDDPVAFLVDFTRQLSHDSPVDVALARSSDRTGVIAGPEVFFTGQRASNRALVVAESLRAVDAARVTRGGPFEATALAADMEDVARTGAFMNETGDATTLLELERRAAPLVRDAAVRRHLQARIAREGDPERPLDGFIAGASHTIDVRIAAPEADWLSVTEAFPDDKLPADRPSTLTVVMTEPHLLERPLVDQIVLPPTGPSSQCTFTLVVPAETASVDARIAVLHRNRVLQTARLPAAVAPGARSGVSVLRDEPPGATPETIVAPLDPGIEERRTFDAAVIVNHDAVGTPRATAVAGDLAATVALDDVSITEAVSKITARLGEIVDAPDDFEGLMSDGARELLVFLAHHGRVMRTALVKDFLGEALSAARFLQVVSARPDAYFPFEFAYDFPAPKEDAEICPSAQQALSAEALESECPGDHSADTVCPFGFWAVNRVIERHAFQPGASVPGPFLVRSSPTRDRSRIVLSPRALVATSSRVDAFAPGSISSLVEGVRTATGRADQVDTWRDWESAVADGDAALLLLVPHTVHSDALDAFGMEIGSDERVWAGDIDERFVPPRERPTIVALLGCETGAAGTVGYERFPGLFRRAGAEVVVATLTEVLGRHAAPVAARLATLLYSCCAEGPRSVGEIMVQMRRRLIADGVLMVLAIAVFGDADWLIATGGSE